MSNHTKILHVTAIFPPEIGGPSKQVWDLANYQHKSGKFTPSVITFSQDNNIKTPFSVIRIPHYKNFPPILGTLFRQSHFGLTLIKIILNEKPDLIHCHDIRVLGLVTGIITKLFGIKSVIKYPGDIVYEIINSEKLIEQNITEVYLHNTKSKFLSSFQKFVLNLFNWVWVVSEYQKNILVDCVRIPANKIIFMPNLINTKVKGLIKKNKTKTILLVARNVPWKQTGKIFNVLSFLPKSKLNINICGNVEDKFKNEANIFSKDKNVSFKFFGKTSPTEMESIYKQSDIFLSLSCYEPFGIVFVEASSFGLPVIAPRIGGIPEVVTHNFSGLLYDSNNWEDAAKQISRLIKDTELFSNLNKNSKTQSSKFDLSRNSQIVDTSYQKIINE